MKKIRIIGFCLVILLFLLTLITMLGSIFKTEKQLSPWGTGFFTIITGSMEPAIPVGSLVFVKSAPEHKIKQNDILTFYAINGVDIVTHRVVNVKESENGYEITTKGDANTANDPIVYYDRVIGRVLFSIPVIGSLANVFQGVKLFGIIIIGIGLIFCILGIYSSIGKKTKDSKSDI